MQIEIRARKRDTIVGSFHFFVIFRVSDFLRLLFFAYCEYYVNLYREYHVCVYKCIYAKPSCFLLENVSIDYHWWTKMHVKPSKKPETMLKLELIFIESLVSSLYETELSDRKCFLHSFSRINARVILFSFKGRRVPPPLCYLIK